MTRHILAPLLVLARAMRPAPPKPRPDPVRTILDGMPIPEHFIGKHFDVLDTEGNIVATTRWPFDPHTASMIG